MKRPIFHSATTDQTITESQRLIADLRQRLDALKTLVSESRDLVLKTRELLDTASRQIRHKSE